MFLAMLLTATAASASAQTPRSGGTCRADQAGDVLLTSVEYADGYRVEAPWRVKSARKEKQGASMTAELDHIIETNPATGKRHRTPLPGTIEMTFEGASSALVLREAADVWCATVAKALSAQEADAPSRVTQKRVVM
jgi:hypothetical protein